MRILMVEDDKHKSDEIGALIFSGEAISTVRSVRDAVIAVEDLSYDLVILDMALPTFAKTPKASGGTSQTQGGVEVLRAMKRAKNTARVIIVSQYPEVEIEGSYVKLSTAAELLRGKYQLDVMGAVLYDYEEKAWVPVLNGLVQNICGH